jgi:hypothetical protein
MAEISQLERALRNADAAGDTQAARMLASEISRMRTQPAAAPAQHGASGSWAQDAPRAPVGPGDAVAGILEPAMNLGSAAIATPLAGFAGLAQGAKNLATGGGMPADDRIAQVQNAMTYQPRTAAGQAVTNVVQYPFQKYGQATDFLGGGAASITGSPAVGAGVKTALDLAPSLLLRGRVGRGSSVTDRPSSTVAAGEAKASRTASSQAERAAGLERVPDKPPALEQLRADANAAYKRAEEAGITVPANSVKGLKTRIVADLKKEGINSKLHPDATAALEEILGTKGEISLTQLETLRKIAGDAQKSIKPADARLASKIVDHIDDLVDTLPGEAGSLVEARGLWSRLRKGEEIESLIEKAKTNSSGFSGSGLENALRTQFRQLANNERKMRRFTAEERAAIKKVATGGGKLSLENLTRYVGKLAPTGGLSTYLGLGAAAMVPGGLAIPAIGGIGRIAATQLTKRNAARASEIMRRGPARNTLGKKAATEERNVLTEQ